MPRALALSVAMAFVLFCLSGESPASGAGGYRIYLESDMEGGVDLLIKRSSSDRYERIGFVLPGFVEVGDGAPRDLVVERHEFFFMRRSASAVNVSLPSLYPVKLNTRLEPDWFRVFAALLPVCVAGAFFAGRRKGPPRRGGYVLGELLGEGGMSSVYRSVAPSGRAVAVKVPDERVLRTGEGFERFAHEARIGSSLRHTGVAEVLDYCLERGGGAFIAMELLEGEPLDSALRPPCPAERVVRCARGIASVLSYVHSEGVVHRDLKPSNVFVMNDGGVKITDFGISRASGMTRITATGSFLGTPAYMAPEQIDGSSADGRADLYALGVIMYEALSGRRPFDDPDPIKLVVKKLSGSAPPLSSVLPEVDPDLESIVMRLLAVSPGDRFPDADSLLSALDEYLNELKERKTV